MSLTLLHNGVDITADYLFEESWSIRKSYTEEKFYFEVRQREDDALNLRVVEDDDVYLTVTASYGTFLLFGGRVKPPIADTRLVDGIGHLQRIVCHDYTCLMDEVFFPPGYYPQGDAYTYFHTYVTTLLGPKGVTVTSPASGGPTIPAFEVTNATTTLRAVVAQWDLVGYTYRINGDKFAALYEPGSTAGPIQLTPASVLALTNDSDVGWRTESANRATRLFLTVDAPESSPDPLYHSEWYQANGTRDTFPVGILPNAKRLATIDNTGGYASGVSSMALRGMTPLTVLGTWHTFQVEGEPETYTLTGSATVDGDGKVTVSFTPTLAVAVAVADQVRWSSNVGVELLIGTTLLADGTPTALDGAPWEWDPIQLALVKTDSAPASPAVVQYRTPMTRPIEVRAWRSEVDAVTGSVTPPNPSLTTGGFDWEAVVDARVEGQAFTDVVQAVQWLRGKRDQYAQAARKQVSVALRRHGWYPGLVAEDCDFPIRLVTGDYLVEEVLITPSGLVGDEELTYELGLREGTDYVPSLWGEARRAVAPGGVNWGAYFPPRVYASQAALEAQIKPAPIVTISQGALEAQMGGSTATTMTFSQGALEAQIQV